MATREEARHQREAKLDELHEKLSGAVERLVTGEDWADALRFAARFRSRSFNNVLLIWEQHQAAFEQGRVPEPFPTYVAGYKQWQQLGWQVEKGQPGYQILAPVTGRFASANPSDPASWRRLNRGEKPKPGEVVRSKMIGLRPAYVWDVSQTAGDPLPEKPQPRLLTGEAPAGPRRPRLHHRPALSTGHRRRHEAVPAGVGEPHPGRGAGCGVAARVPDPAASAAQVPETAAAVGAD